MNRHLGLGAAIVLTLSASLAGCSGSPETPPARAAAEGLAGALSSGHLHGIGFTGRSAVPAQKWWNRTVAAMGSSKPQVQVRGVKETADHTKATATLAYDWDLAGSGSHWKYQTTAQLLRTADTWKVARDPALLAPSLRSGESLALSKEAAPRGDILGAHGDRLVTDRPVLRFGIDKTQVGKARQPASARALARLVGIDPGAYVGRVRAAGEKAFVEAIVLRKLEVDPRVRTGYLAIHGAVALPDKIPLGLTHDFARPVLGTVGPVTAEIVKKSKGVYAAGDEAGLSGLEQRYDSSLRGAPGLVVDAVDTKTDARRKLFAVAPKAGRPLRTTLDQRKQLLAEQLLSGVHPASALVAIRPSDGSILAAASGPGSNGYSTSTVGTYAPGSTFKVVSSLALLRAGLKPTTTVPCPLTTVVDGKTFKNYSDYPPGGIGNIPLRTAVANSCNTAFISERGKVSQADVAEAAASLGLGVDHDIGFPAYFGAVPRSATGTEHAASMIGQGQVLASPMAMATVAASVAKGATVVPRLLDGTASVKASPTTPLTATEAGQLRGLMRAVVTDGSGTALLSVPGAPVLAKTGTAEFGSKSPPRTHAWMIAVHGDLAVAVFVDVGASGSGTAGPILNGFLRGG
jgi:cell division protein FtsI/penicillin-binding protein 2